MRENQPVEVNGKHEHDEGCWLVEIRGLYDGALFYACSDGVLRHRFPEEHYLRPVAATAMAQWRGWQEKKK